MGMLTERDINLYNESGYVVPDFQLDAEIVEEIGFYHDHLIKKHPEYSDYCPAVLCYETGFLKFARIPEILDMVEQLIGPDFALWNSGFWHFGFPDFGIVWFPNSRISWFPGNPRGFQ